jgi:hypothetical protein
MLQIPFVVKNILICPPKMWEKNGDISPYIKRGIEVSHSLLDLFYELYFFLKFKYDVRIIYLLWKKLI